MFYMGSYVREYRRKVAPNLSASQFAEEVGISPSDLSKIETNKKRLTMTHVMLMTLRYEDKSLYFRYRQMLDEYIFECFEKKQLISV
jgi:transcriptional regulator with XRE-family HTH domain